MLSGQLREHARPEPRVVVEGEDHVRPPRPGQHAMRARLPEHAPALPVQRSQHATRFGGRPVAQAANTEAEHARAVALAAAVVEWATARVQGKG
jgi:hypothetical protein